MAYLYRIADDDARARVYGAVAQPERPLQSTVWMVLAFCSFTWVAIIFACIELL